MIGRIIFAFFGVAFIFLGIRTVVSYFKATPADKRELSEESTLYTLARWTIGGSSQKKASLENLFVGPIMVIVGIYLLVAAFAGKS